MNGKKQFGDYQTPSDFARRVCDFLKARCVSPKTVIEPTCGVGNFLKASLSFGAQNYYGIELDPEYCQQCEQNIADPNVTIINADIFYFDFDHLCPDLNDVLVIGNPPWVTSSELSRQNATNVPPKTNFKEMNGLNAIMGASNFDVAEYIILRLIDHIKAKDAVLAMLCKPSVARNVFQEINRKGIAYKNFSIYRFDAWDVFHVNASACLLLIEFQRFQDCVVRECKVYDFDESDKLKETLLYSKGAIRQACVGDDFDGESCFEWRQGVKHDCSKIMELSFDGVHYINGKQDVVNIENSYVFPLIKGSMFKRAIIERSSKYVIVTQTKIKQDTAQIQLIAPHTWQYLWSNRESFDSRKSTIYRNAPPFSMFGIGDYSFAKYKIGICGFYKVPLFAMLKGEDKPIMTDDTSYFISFDSYDMAYVAMLCLNSDRVRTYLMSTSFQDAKRPFTKHMLSHLDFKKVTNALTLSALLETEEKLNLTTFVKPDMYDRFKGMIAEASSR